MADTPPPAYTEEAPPPYTADADAGEHDPEVEDAGERPKSGGDETLFSKVSAGLSSTLATVASTTKRTAASLSLSMGMTYSAGSFCAAFGLDPESNPLLGGFTTWLVTGSGVQLGQYYVSPTALCIYTHSGKRIVKLSIPWSEIGRVEPRVATNLADVAKSGASPDLVPPGSVGAEASRPNSLNLYTGDGTVHTFVGGKGAYLIGLSLVYVAWARAAPAAAAAEPWIPRVGLKLHTSFGLPPTEFILRSLRGAVVSGANVVPTLIQVWGSCATFIVHDTPVTIPWVDVQSITPAKAVKNPDKSIKAPVLVDVQLNPPADASSSGAAASSSGSAPPSTSTKVKKRFGGFASGLKTKMSTISAMTGLGSAAPVSPEQAAAGKPPDAIKLHMRQGVMHQITKIDFATVYNVMMYAWAGVHPGVPCEYRVL